MAENKKSVLLYCDIIHTVEKLDDETAGKLFKHYLRYINDLNPETDNIIVDVVFEPIKQNLKRDLISWQERKDNYSKAGKASVESRRNKKEQKQTTLSVVKDVKKRFNFRKSLIDYGFEESLVVDWIEVRKRKKASNTKTAFNGFIKQVELSNKDINFVLTECVNRSWGGFKSEWLNKSNESTGKPKKVNAGILIQEKYGLNN